MNSPDKGSSWLSAVAALRKATRVVVFSGAGISAESGVPTFRDSDGFWQRFPPEHFATWSGLRATILHDPRAVAEFIWNVVDPIAKAAPNPAHHAVAELGRRVRTTVITQNVDNLHQAAGSTEVFEIHGTLYEMVDSSTGELVRRFDQSDLARIAEVLRSYISQGPSAGSILEELRQVHSLDWLGRHRPRLVLFGDAMAEPAWTDACRASQECDLFLQVGTSGEVQPAASLPERAADWGATVITIDPHPNSGTPGLTLRGPAGTLLPQLLHDTFGPQ